MVSIIGIDSRIFIREVIKKNGEEGHFKSVLGVAVKVKDYLEFDKQYTQAMKYAFSTVGEELNYKCYCTNDIKDHKSKIQILTKFCEKISKHIEKIHVFYTLFSPQKLKEVNVYGRMAQKKHLKLSEPTRSYETLIREHLIQCFPAICAWRLTEHLFPGTVEFHLDSYSGHIFEAQERLETTGFRILIYPSGDCSNPVISTADLILDLLDKRLELSNKLLIFDNIRPALFEFGEDVLVYPITNKHLHYITPLDKKSIDTIKFIKHPVYWVFKGDQLIESGTMKRSLTYRNLIDFVASQHGVVKMFEKSKDIEYIKNDDFGVYINNAGKEIIETYIKLGKTLKHFKMDSMVCKKR